MLMNGKLFHVKIDVCVFTHNPKREIFAKALGSLARQTLTRDRFHVWVVDNSSSPPLGEADLMPLRAAGVEHTLLVEKKLGLSHARVAAIKSTRCEWLVFVDDDNELFEDYLAQVVAVIAAKPQLGCFGGKLLLPEGYEMPVWMRGMLPYVGIKDCGDQPITNCVDHWGDWEPPGAGAVVRRPLAELFCQRMQQFGDSGRLGRCGKHGLMSCEDSLLARGAFRLGLHCSYEPSLRLWHHINPARLQFRYFVRLFFNYGRSYVVLERSLGNMIQPKDFKDLWKLITNFPRSREKICRLAWQWGYLFESRNQSDLPLVVANVDLPAAPIPPPQPAPARDPSIAANAAVPTLFRMEDALAHLVNKGFQPNVVLDAGAHKGYWSELANYFFPEADFFLIEPVSANEPRLKDLCAHKPTLHYLMLAVGDQPGEQVMNVTPDLVASSLLPLGSEWQAHGEKVRVETIDSLLEKRLVQPPQLVKMDLQGFELKALEGGARLFDTAEVFILEALLYEIMPGTPIFHEIVEYMARRGYVVFDIAGYLHREFEKDLGQLDVVFVKKTSPLVASKRWV
jgi:FkbM family methyltransferase